jgi:hypothetical protein
VRVSPATFGDIRPHPESIPGPGTVVIRTNRYLGSGPVLSLIGKQCRNWSESFVTLEFLDALETPVEQLWQWTKRVAGGGRPVGAS